MAPIPKSHHEHRLDLHPHAFVPLEPGRAEKRAWLVAWITAAMMLVEIGGGLIFNSMALLADGWHMATHAGALMVAGLAYSYARSRARDPRFSFSTGKVGDLAAFGNAVALGFVSALLLWESGRRLLSPEPIGYDEAIMLAVVGLIVNIVCAVLLGGGHGHSHAASGHAHERDQDHSHDHSHEHEHEHEHEHDHSAAGRQIDSDLNLRAAFVHVLADAATSVAAILGLLGGKFFGWAWADPALGIVGGLVILRWALSLARDSGGVLLDAAPDDGAVRAIRAALEDAEGRDRIADLHVWRVAPGHRAAVVSLVAQFPEAPEVYKSRLAHVPGLSHVTVEVNPCPDCESAEAAT